MDYNVNIFSQIFHEFGYDALLDEKRFLAIFGDYAPNKDLDKQLLLYIYKSNAMEYIYGAITCGEKTFSLARKAFLKIIESGYSGDQCWKIISELINSVEIKYIKLPQLPLIV